MTRTTPIAAPIPAQGEVTVGDVRIGLGFLLVGAAMFAFGRLWRAGRLGRDPAGFAARAILLEPIGCCWAVLGAGALLGWLGVPQAVVVPIWFVGFAVFVWGLVLGIASPDWYKPAWLERDERAGGMRPWRRWNRFWLIATALICAGTLLFALLMLAVGLADG